MFKFADVVLNEIYDYYCNKINEGYVRKYESGHTSDEPDMIRMMKSKEALWKALVLYDFEAVHDAIYSCKCCPFSPLCYGIKCQLEDEKEACEAAWDIGIDELKSEKRGDNYD